MTYADLYADASVYMSLNNTYDYVTTGVLGATSGTGTPVFSTDAPTNTGSTHSLKASNYTTTPPRHQFYNVPAVESEARSVSFWYKYSKVGGGTFAPLENTGSSIQMYINDPRSGTSDESTMTINGGSWKLDYTASDRKIVVVSKDVTTASAVTTTTVTTNQKLNDGQWHHIAMVERKLPTLTTIERAVYVDGICWSFINTTNMNGFTYNFGNGSAGWGFKIFQTLGTDAADKFIAHYAMWTRALSKDEIRAQAWYGLTGGDYTALVLSDNPSYFTTLDNEDKATPATVYGNTSWGALNDDQSCVVVNQLGYPTGKSWKTTNTGTSTTNVTSTTTPELINGINSLIRSGEFSFEFWFKTVGKETRYVLEYSPGSNGAGYNVFRIDSSGRAFYTMAYKSGTSTYVTGAVGSTQPVGLAGTKIYHGDTSASLEGFTDGQWHHVVYAQSNTEQYGSVAGAYWGVLYVDGYAVDRRNWVNTYGWLDLLPTGVSNFYRMGNQSAPINDFFYDSIAMYSRRLTNEEVAEHYIAGKTYVVPAGRTVKYWDGTQWSTSSDQKVYNGTDWVNWDAKRYDGNSWITV
jgi:hypothetical protein